MADNIISNALDFARPRELELGKSRVNKAIDESLSEITIPKNIKIEKDYKQNVEMLFDIFQLKQAFSNIITNSIQAIKDRGRIRITTEKERDSIKIVFEDNGKGIAKEDLPKVFSRFQQFSRTPGPGYKGTGLGLAIVKELVELHKGEIKVESELNQGTQFIFTLPKIGAEEVFKEYINNGIKEAADRKSPLSLVVVHILEFSQLQEKWGEKPLYLLTDIEKVIKDSLRRRTDTVLRSTGELAIPLPDTRKEDAEVVKKRIEEAIRTYLSQCKEEWIKEIRITLGTATYPDEANNHQELLDKARTGERH